MGHNGKYSAVKLADRGLKDEKPKAWLVVPAGLCVDASGRFHLSTAFRSELRYILEHVKSDDLVVLLPANSYGEPRGRREQDFAAEFLKENGLRAEMKVIEKNEEAYIDTRGNVRGLIEQLIRDGEKAPFFKGYDIVVVAYLLQALRALVVMTQEGIRVQQLIGTMPSRVSPDEKMAPGLGYYYKPEHILYEIVATLLSLLQMDQHIPKSLRKT